MKKISLVISIFAIGAVIINNASPVFAATPEELRRAIEDRAKELQDINQQIRQTQSNLQTTTQKTKSLSREIQQIDHSISQLNLGVRASEIQISKLSLEIDSLSYSIKDREAEIQLKKEVVGNFLRELQTKSRESELFIFLRSQSLSDSLFETQALHDLSDRMSSEIDELFKITTALAADLDTTEKKKRAANNEALSLMNKKAVIEDQKVERKDLLANTKSQEKLYQSQLSELEQKQRKIGADIENFERELRETFNEDLLPVKHPGVFQLPIPNPVYLTQEYGATAFAKQAYSSKFHNGLDFGSAFGTPVYAARNGKVVIAGNNGRYQYGKYVIIEHDNGLSTLYAHLSVHNVSQNQTVRAGEIIGSVGNTGYSTGPHLHFTVYWTPSLALKDFPNCNCGLVPVGVTADPFDYLQRM